MKPELERAVEMAQQVAGVALQAGDEVAPVAIFFSDGDPIGLVGIRGFDAETKERAISEALVSVVAWHKTPDFVALVLDGYYREKVDEDEAREVVTKGLHQDPQAKEAVFVAGSTPEWTEVALIPHGRRDDGTVWVGEALDWSNDVEAENDEDADGNEGLQGMGGWMVAAFERVWAMRNPEEVDVFYLRWLRDQGHQVIEL